MADVTPFRSLMTEEETDYNSAVSESLLQKQAANNNFIHKFQTKHLKFKFLGNFSPLTLPEDGAEAVLFDSEIVGISGILFDRGDSGTTELDLKVYRNGVDQGSILTTTLQITQGAGVAQFFTELETPNSSATAGVTLPVIDTAGSKQVLQPGDAIVPKLVSAAVSVENLTITVHYRPDNP